MEKNFFVKHFFPFMADYCTDLIPIFKSRAVESFQWNVCPQISEIRIIDLKDSLCLSLFYHRLEDRMLYDFIHRILRSHSLEIYNSACEPRCRISEQISAVKNRHFFCSFSS